MKLTKINQTRRIQDLKRRIKSKHKKLICPICSNNEFILGEGCSKKYLYKSTQDISSNLFIPNITLVCTNCGNILDFSTRILDQYQKEKSSKRKLRN